MWFAAAMGSSVLGNVANVGQLWEVCLNEVHQRVNMWWSRRNYSLDAQSVRLDALDHAKEEIKVHYDTYVHRINTNLVITALLFPFALSMIQFSGPFIPRSAEECHDQELDCVEQEAPWLVIAWACLLAVVLVLPFWGMLMLIWCKVCLERWLFCALGGIHSQRVHIVGPQGHCDTGTGETLEAENAVYSLVQMVLSYQEYLATMWEDELGCLVLCANALLWLSASFSVMLTTLSTWIMLVNQGGVWGVAGNVFAVTLTMGGTLPLMYVAWRVSKEEVKPPVFSHRGEGSEEHTEDVVQAAGDAHALAGVTRGRLSLKRRPGSKDGPGSPAASTPGKASSEGTCGCACPRWRQNRRLFAPLRRQVHDHDSYMAALNGRGLEDTSERGSPAASSERTGAATALAEPWVEVPEPRRARISDIRAGRDR